MPATKAICCCAEPPTCMLEREYTTGDPDWQGIPCPYPVCDAFWDQPDNVMYTRYDAELRTDVSGFFDAEQVDYEDMAIWSPYTEGAGFIPQLGAGDNGTVVYLPEAMWAPLRDNARGYKLRGTIDTSIPNHHYDRIGNRWGADTPQAWHEDPPYGPGSMVKMNGCKLHEQSVFVGGHTHVIEWWMYYFGFSWNDSMCSLLPGGGEPPSGSCPGTNWQTVPALSAGGVAWAATYKNSSVIFGQNDTGVYPDRDTDTEAQAFVYIAFGGNQDEGISHSYITPHVTPQGAWVYETIPYYSGPLSLVDRGWHWVYEGETLDPHDAGPQHRVGWRMLFPWDEPYPEPEP